MLDEEAVRSDERRKVAAMLKLIARYVWAESKPGTSDWGAAAGINHVAEQLSKMEFVLEDVSARTFH